MVALYVPMGLSGIAEGKVKASVPIKSDGDSSGKNLVNNPDFLSGLDHWIMMDSSGKLQASVEQRNGRKALKMSYEPPAEIGWPAVVQDLDLTPGKAYTMSVDIDVENTRDGAILCHRASGGFGKAPRPFGWRITDPETRNLDNGTGHDPGSACRCKNENQPHSPRTWNRLVFQRRGQGSDQGQKWGGLRPRWRIQKMKTKPLPACQKSPTYAPSARPVEFYQFNGNPSLKVAFN